MSVKVEKLDGNMAKLTIESTVEEFEEALNKAYLKNKNKIQIQGFRKGKAPRAMIEKIYGPGVFYEDAANEIIPGLYEKAMASDECKDLEVVSRPEVDVLQIEKGKTFIFTADVALKPEVELGKYKAFRVAKKKAEVSEDDVNAELKRVQEQNARTITIEDRPIQDKDIAVIDYEGSVDGVPFDGGKADGHELTIGSHSFIDTFEDQLIGHKAGDEVDVHVTFPTEYHAENLAGKAALFKVKVQAIKARELPELNDEFAEEVSDFDNLADYKKDIEKKLADKKQTELDNERKQTILKKAVENAKMEIPQAMIDEQARQLVNDYAQRMQMQGISMDMYLKYTGQTVESLTDQFKDEAKNRIENSLVLEAISKAENVEVSEEDVEAELQKMAEMYKMELSKVKELMGEYEIENLKKELAANKAYDIITK